MAPGRPRRTRPNRVAEEPPRRSHAAIPVALVLVGAGVYLGRFSILLPVLFGVALLWSGLSFLSTRVNPLSATFYLTTKPSWTAILVVFLGALALLGAAYALWTSGSGPILPRW